MTPKIISLREGSIKPIRIKVSVYDAAKKETKTGESNTDLAGKTIYVDFHPYPATHGVDPVVAKTLSGGVSTTGLSVSEETIDGVLTTILEIKNLAADYGAGKIEVTAADGDYKDYLVRVGLKNGTVYEDSLAPSQDEAGVTYELIFRYYKKYKNA